MGYYSNFEIHKYKNNIKENITQEELEELSIISRYIFEYPEIEYVKWYSIIQDMKEFSKKYPQYKWIVYQEGEDRDDYRKYIFKNGKYKELVAKVEIIYPDEDSIEWKEN